MAKRKRNSEGKFASKGVTGPVRDNPWTSAAIAAGAAGIGAFLWSKRSQIGEAVNSGMDSLAELKSDSFDGSKSQSEIAEEALSLKETGEQPGFSQSNQEAKAGAKAYS